MAAGRFNEADVSVGRMADAAMTASAIGPAEYGAMAWTVDPLLAINVGTFTAGNLYYAMIKTAVTKAITGCTVVVTTGGSGLTYGAVALYTQSGQQIAITPDQHTAWQSIAVQSANFTTPTPVIPAGTVLWVAIGTLGTTGPAFQLFSAMGSRNALLNATSGLRNGVNVGGVTNPLPSKLVQSTGTTTTNLPLVILT